MMPPQYSLIGSAAPELAAVASAAKDSDDGDSSGSSTLTCREREKLSDAHSAHTCASGFSDADGTVSTDEGDCACGGPCLSKRARSAQ